MIKKIMLCVVGLTAIKMHAQVVPNIDWVKYYSERANINNVPTTLDANNNAYLTGFANVSSSVIAMKTLKYDSLGNNIFTASYSNGSFDAGNAIKVDAAGNVYVTGISFSSSSNRDYVTVKYSPTGTQLWLTKFNGTGNNIDEANDLKLDASGNVYVTGKSLNTSGNYDIVTVKYNNSGVQQWANVYNGSPNKDDVGTALVLSSNGSNVFVTGVTTNASLNTDVITYQLNASTGAIGWKTITNGSANSTDVVNAITLSGANVVVCGYLNNTTTGNDYFTIKYKGSTGSIQWQKSYDFGNGDNRSTALVKDSTGNIGVTGTAKVGSLTEIHTLLYDSIGTQLWINKEVTGLSSLNVNPKIATDSIANHFYVSGQIMKASADVYVYQITPTGNTTWKQTWDGTVGGNDAATNLCVNGVGVVYLSAQCKNVSTKYDYTTIKISQTPVYFPLDFGAQELNDKGFVFQENKGQLLTPAGAAVSNTVIEYYNQSSTPSYYINKSRISAIIANSNTVTNLPDSLVRVDMNFLNTNSLTQIYKYNKVAANKNYFINSSTGITDVGSYERLLTPNLYSNIDVHYYSNSKGLKCYLVCKIAETFRKPIINISGVLTSTINGNGELIATTNLGTINYGKLTAYQATVNPITLTYTLLPVSSAAWSSLGSNNYGFNVTGYNSAYPLVIYFSKQGATSSTAVSSINNMYWSTFVGGQGSDTWRQSKVDAKDNYYTVGNTSAINFPTFNGPFQNQPPSNGSGMQWGILSKFDKDGAIKYSTYFGGSNPYDICGNPSITQIQDIAIDSTYNMYIVGRTTSTSMFIQPNPISGALNYPTNSANTNISGGCTNGFIAKIQAPGNALWFSSYYGGSKLEAFTCVKYMKGQIYLGGISRSTSIPLNTPLPNTYQLSTGDGGMYMHLDTTGVLKHVTKLQGFVRAGDADKNGNYYLVSDGALASVPVITPAGTFYGAGPASVAADWGIQRFSIADSLTWSTNYGGTGNDYPSGIFIRDSVMAIVGSCDGNFPIVKSATDSGDVSHANGSDISLVKFNTKTGQRFWSVLHATGNNDNAYACVLDKDYNLYVTGSVKCGATNTLYPCASNNFKNTATGGYYNQANKIDYDAFILGYNNKNQRKWTTNFGSLAAGSNGYYNYDAAYCIAVNNQSKLFIAGETDVKNNSLPLVRWNSVCYYDSLCADVYPSSAYDAFITMFDVSNFVAVGIKEESKKVDLTSNISLYPNPNNGIFTLQFKEQPIGRLSLNIVNILGQKVYELNNTRFETNELKIHLENLTKGIYFITVSENNKPHTIKFIVQ
jgi:hypothetical protein